ncbi:hypothetical protein J1605_010179 [Eschrichtius robustus]|uniref:Toll-like receptor 2 n=1 Tax=Eschrichtius robustus TaxID=9764 RepID=A0AB34GPV3_ESCRO|nr:hypothetical protein J1605_010179 [Eschrichtius robustus]
MPPALWTVWVLGSVISLPKEGASDQASSLSCDPTGVCDGRSRSFNSIPSGLTAAVKSLDLSSNEITYVSNSDLRRCVNLRALRLGANEIHTVEEDSFFSLRSLEYLDLSYNRLSNFSSSWFRSLSALKFLNLLGNLYKTLGERSLFSHLPNLRILKVGNSNSFTEIQEKDFAGLTLLEKLEINAPNLQTYAPKSLKSIQNISHLILHLKQPILLLEIFGQQALAQVLIDWPEDYLCDSPSPVRGQRVQDTWLSPSECHRAAVVSAVCCALFLLLLLVGILCHRFHGLWYMKMMWAWLQAKRKPRKAPRRDICYDAFVSYSERDSYWVENLMVQELEHFNPPFKLCLHKRDFIPGKWIIDNIIDSIEKSHKTIFVLSENFVKSEWCKYELDFSHFRLFDENNDAAILILLEPIEKKAIPQRFCKLRKIMNTKTYLEWPTDEMQQEGFWLNLRAAIKS